MGIFTVSIVNDLVAPIETDGSASDTKAPVQVNVYFKGGSDLQFAQPSEDSSGWSLFKMEPYSYLSTDGGSSEMPSIDEHKIIGQEVDDNNTSVFFGENIVSLRALLKRYVNVFTGDYVATTPGENYDIIQRYMPWIPAQIITGKARRNSYLSYFAPGFIAGRGSTRYKLAYFEKGRKTSDNLILGNYNWVERVGLRQETKSINYTIVDGSGASSAELDSTIPHGYNGACFTSGNYNPCLEFQIPFYSNTRYNLMCDYFNVGGGSDELLKMNTTMTQILAARNVYSGFAARANVMQQWHSAGDDFSLHFFTGVPMYFFDA